MVGVVGVKFYTKYVQEDKAVLRKGNYVDESIALMVYDQMGERLSVPTVCLVDYDEKPAEGNVFIRDYSETEGAYQALKDAGVVGEAIREIPFGGYDAKAYECKLLINPEGLLTI